MVTMSTTRIRLGLLLLVVAAGGCVAEVGDTERLQVTLAFASNAVTVVDLKPGSLSRASAGALRYELYDRSGVLCDEGAMADPRAQRLDLFDESSPTRSTAAESGLVSVTLPRVAGDLLLLEPAAGGWRELASLPFDPQPRVAQTAQDSDILGPPALLSGSGDPDRSLNIIVAPEGFTEVELPQFRKDADELVRQLKKQKDFGAHWSQISVWRLDVRSTQSGIDDPAQSIQVETAFDVSFGNPRRAIWIRGQQGLDLAARVRSMVHAQLLVVLANIDETGGAGTSGLTVMQHRVGAFETFLGYGVGALLAHEAGHAVVVLADEYVDQDLCTSWPTPHANISTSFERGNLPWADLVATSTSLPTTSFIDSLLNRVGAYEGAGYCGGGVYRPQRDCLMRSHNSSMCAVCRRELDRYFERLASK
jgi:hypothetical protein